MNADEFRKQAHRLVDWMADYLATVDSRRVMSASAPGEILSALPDQPPRKGEPFKDIFADFEQIVLPGMTHWQHPSFFAYFPANSSFPSLLGEMLTSTLAAQCMIWQTSPAAAELEERMMQWLQQMTGLPDHFTGVIQDTASTATLCAFLTAREKHSGFRINHRGFKGDERFVSYCSSQTHSSIDKAVRIAGLGDAALRKIEVDDQYAMKSDVLARRIKEDQLLGLQPLCVVATIGTTGSTAIDPLKQIAEICRSHNIWLHVDAAFAGTALILPELRWMIEGIEHADSFVFNPHKWMFTNFDCSAYYVRDPETLIRTFEILPEYLKTATDGEVKNYRDWGIALGRRFRALKLWFVIRSFGIDGLQERLRLHLDLAQRFAAWVDDEADFQRLAPVPLNTICFRYAPPDSDEKRINALNAELLKRLNSSGELYMTHTTLGEKYTLRMVIGQTYVQEHHIVEAWRRIQAEARRLGGAS